MSSLHALRFQILAIKPSEPVPMQMSEAQQDVEYISATVQKVSYKDGIFMMSLAFDSACILLTSGPVASIRSTSSPL